MSFLRFESKKSSVIQRKRFIIRALRYILYAIIMVAISVSIGTLGYHYFGSLSWIDAFYNACMILAGVGPIAPMPTDTAKIFASFYALFSGTAFFSVIAVVMAPIVHRFLHIINSDNTE
ncbi:hypothetical protein IMCC3317_15180 [Kordia antarctica]|uniref:Potassium channel domain-containing protein n=1 Tax=Kordia antarctica TaxID=1218801 RepID=A0A7L4ZIB6_9FLAO|nr:hypothetical protein [Kordia antarctica]QHI36159.1 hypothetical protein IMCC3317_15180 [Kordia antarctica]